MGEVTLNLFEPSIVTGPMPDAVQDHSASSPSMEMSQPWNYRHLGIAWIVGLLFKPTLLGCMCAIGSWRMSVGFCFDALVALRIFMAFVRDENGPAWVIYAALCYTSAFWIQWLTTWILSFNGTQHC